MRKTDVVTIRVPTADIIINHNEEAMRLKVTRDYQSEMIDMCRIELRSVLDYRYSYIKSTVTHISDSVCDIGFGNIESRDLCKVLNGCREAYILGVTTGIDVDRLLERYSLTSPSKCFITDALASAAAESLCEYADNALRGSCKKPMRYSPGYGDLPLSCQKSVLEAIDAGNTLGIILNDSLLMTPVKSITAIMGVYDD